MDLSDPAGVDIVIGSRFLDESSVSRTSDLEATSVGFNWMFRLLIASSIRDHLCGFKAFRRDKLMSLMPYVQVLGWTWYTEVLTWCRRDAGMSLKRS